MAFPNDSLDNGEVHGRQDDVFQAPRRLLHCEERYATLMVVGSSGIEPPRCGGPRLGRTPVKNALQVVRQEVVLLLPLLGNDLLRDTPEGVQIAVRSRTHQLPQQIAVRHSQAPWWCRPRAAFADGRHRNPTMGRSEAQPARNTHRALFGRADRPRQSLPASRRPSTTAVKSLTMKTRKPWAIRSSMSSAPAVIPQATPCSLQAASTA